MRSTLCALTIALLTASGALAGPPAPNPDTCSKVKGKWDCNSVRPEVGYTTEWFHGNVPVLLRHYGENVIRVSRRSYGNV